MTNKEIKVCKEQILKYLTEDFNKNQAIFNKEKGYAIYNDTDLTMVMDKVVGGLYSAKRKLETESKKKEELYRLDDFVYFTEEEQENEKQVIEKLKVESKDNFFDYYKEEE